MLQHYEARMIKGNNSLKWKIAMSTFKDPFIKSNLLSVSACLTLFLTEVNAEP